MLVQASLITLVLALITAFSHSAAAAPTYLSSRNSNNNNNRLHQRNCLADIIQVNNLENSNLLIRRSNIPHQSSNSPPPSGFTYEGETGPKEWGTFTPICETGELQSPIDFEGSSLLISEKPKVASWPAGEVKKGIEFLNNGHTIQVQFAKSGVSASTKQVDGREYVLQQMHLHSPSEHHVEGKCEYLAIHLFPFLQKPGMEFGQVGTLNWC
jgi:carbonic anhydrase